MFLKPIRLNSASAQEALVTTIMFGAGAALFAYSAWNAGGFWRDEVNTLVISLAGRDKWFPMTQLDSMPIGSNLLVQLCATLTPFLALGSSLRFMGFLIGLCLLALMWRWGAKDFRARPYPGMAVILLSPIILRYGIGLRPYGVAALLGLLALVAVHHYIQAPSRRALALVALASLLNIHVLLANSVIVTVAAGVGALLCVISHRTRDALSLCIAAFAPFATLIIYRQKFANLASYSASVQQAQRSLLKFCTHDLVSFFLETHWLVALVWLSLAVAGIAGAFYLLKKRQDTSTVVYLLVVPLLAVLGTAFLFYVSGTLVNPWYLVPVTVLCAFSWGVLIVRALDVSGKPRFTLLLPSIVCLPLALWLCVPRLKLRMTTADLAARILNDRAGPDDVIIVNPWYAATSFNYYYSGKAPFFSIPPIENYQIQHADLVAAKLSDPNAIEPLKRKISTALSTGHLVWFVGGLQLQLANWQTAKWVPDTSGTLPERRTRAILLWNAEIGQEVQPYLGGASRVPLGAAANSYENLSLTVINPNVVTH